MPVLFRLIILAALGLNPQAYGEGAAPKQISGKVIETMDAASYTYMQLESADGKIGKDGRVWLAARQVAVKRGDNVTFTENKPQKDFHSKALNRDFESIYFVNHLVINAAASETSVSVVQKVKDLEDLYARRVALAGATVSVTGKVVKVNPEIMGKNWIHLTDASLTGKEKDLTVTSDALVKVGDQVTLTGKVATDKDFGAGYLFPVILEDAK